MTRLSTGIPGFDAVINGGLPVGSSLILQGPPGEEKNAFAFTFLAEGLRSGASGLVVTASQSPTAVVEALRALGVDVDLVAKENRLRIVDWYSWSEREIPDIEEHGIILTAPVDLAHAGAALSRAIAALGGDAPKRAVVEMLSPALGVYELNQVYAFAQSSKRKLERFAFTALFLLEKDMHNAAQITTLHQPFDGVIEIERSRHGDRIIRKIGVLHLKDTKPDSTFLPFEFSNKGLSVGGTAPPTAAVRASTAASSAKPPGPTAPGKGGATSPKRPPPDREPLRRRVQGMADIARERLRRSPEDADALFALAASEAILGSTAVAIELLDRLQNLDANYPGLWDLKAKLYAGVGDATHWEEARERADRAYSRAVAEPGTPAKCRSCGAEFPAAAEVCPLCGVAVAKEHDLLQELDNLAKSAGGKGAAPEEGEATELGPEFWDELAALAAVEPALALEEPKPEGAVQELVEPEPEAAPSAPAAKAGRAKEPRGRGAERSRKAGAKKGGARDGFVHRLAASSVARFGIPIAIAAAILLIPMLFMSGGPWSPGTNQSFARATPAISGMELNPLYGDVMGGTNLSFRVIVAQNSYLVAKSIRPVISGTNLSAGTDVVLAASLDNVTFSFVNPSVTQSGATFTYDFGPSFEQSVNAGATGASAPSWYFQVHYVVSQLPASVITWNAQFVSGS